jgi:membrane associated rhomboid family serine protease
VPTNRLLLGAMVAAYGLQSLLGKAMLFAGARINQYILYSGQWHRLITPMWLHGSPMHLLSNSYSLFYLGPSAERIFGSEIFLLLFLLSGIGGNLLGLRFGAVRGMSVGASGAVFGLMGSLAGYAARNYGTASSQATLSSLSRVLVSEFLPCGVYVTPCLYLPTLSSVMTLSPLIHLSTRHTASSQATLSKPLAGADD